MWLKLICVGKSVMSVRFLGYINIYRISRLGILWKILLGRDFKKLEFSCLEKRYIIKFSFKIIWY